MGKYIIVRKQIKSCRERSRTGSKCMATKISSRRAENMLFYEAVPSQIMLRHFNTLLVLKDAASAPLPGIGDRLGGGGGLDHPQPPGHAQRAGHQSLPPPSPVWRPLKLRTDHGFGKECGLITSNSLQNSRSNHPKMLFE